MGGLSTIIVLSSLPDEAKPYKNLIIYSCVVSNGILAQCLSASNFCGTIVLEREKNLKYALNVMGCRILPYWLGSFLFDFVIFFLQFLAFMVTCVMFNFSCVTHQFGEISLVFIPFGVTFIGCNYLFSHMFDKSATAYKWIIWINYLVLFVIGVVLYFLTDFINNMNVRRPVQIVILCIMPLETFYFGFFNAGVRYYP